MMYGTWLMVMIYDGYDGYDLFIYIYIYTGAAK